MSRINKMCNFNHGMTIRVSKCLPIYIYIYIYIKCNEAHN